MISVKRLQGQPDEADLTWLLQHDHLARHWPDATPEQHIRDKASRGEYLILRDDMSPIGYLRFSRFWLSPYIDLIHVDPGHRGQQLGRKLVDALIDLARAEGVPEILSSSQSNEPAPQAFHRAIGFVEIGRLSGVNDDGSDEVMFRYSL